MNGCYLNFYLSESLRHHQRPGYEWLLEEARKLGIHGGSAFRAMAGFGRRGRLHEDHFFELAGELPIEVAFAVSDADAERLLGRVRDEKLNLFYLRMPAEFGFTLDQTG